MAKSKSKKVFSCQSCGSQYPKWQGQCTDCGEWNTLVEEQFSASENTRGWSIGEEHGKSISLDQNIKEQKALRTSTNIEELDRVLGGGLVEGSFTLLGGDPGIGKSTLLMQMAGGLAKSKAKVLYISCEESVAQTGMRAQRLGVRDALVEVASESNLDKVINLCKKQKPDVVIIDSIQTIYLPSISSAPGSVSQVRECAGHLMMLAKSFGMSVLLIGHVTKDGNIAGPKTLEHMVDTVMSFEGDRSHQFRLLRSMKNRFGAANQLGVFQMSEDGLEEVKNPSELFLEERGSDLIGSAVFSSMEGSRPLLCEIQALCNSSQMAMPRRTAIGMPHNRLHLLLAVLDKHLNMNFANNEVYVNVVGGLKIEETAADLAIVASLISSEGNIEVDPKTCFFGELGLTGEIRAVSFAETRVEEAAKLGFERFYLPFSNKKHLKSLKTSLQNKIVYVKNLRDLQRNFPVARFDKNEDEALFN
jgi:DNA repair protein RadA/Sms